MVKIDPYNDVDVCVALIHTKRPSLPLREELQSLGAETIYAPRGTADKVVTKKVEEVRERRFRQSRQESIAKEDIVCYGQRDECDWETGSIGSCRSSLTYEDVQSIMTYETLETLQTLDEKSREDEISEASSYDPKYFDADSLSYAKAEPDRCEMKMEKEESSQEDWKIDFQKRLLSHEVHVFSTVSGLKKVVKPE
mmetsp:Transcript_8041/g.11652  ORF Transcript_8041/g.11652 Transcript_8041/m.11652 type:complete len:196 (-) Transcript_8041:117-704(-)